MAGCQGLVHVSLGDVHKNEDASCCCKKLQISLLGLHMDLNLNDRYKDLEFDLYCRILHTINKTRQTKLKI